MQPNAAESDRRLGAFFAAYYAGAGVFVAYFPLYLEFLSLTAAQIGIVLAVGQGMRVVGPNLWAYLADHTARRIAILRWSAVAVCAAFTPMLMPGGFWVVLAAMFVVNFFLTAQIPIGEAIAATSMRDDPRAATRYGRLRAWGSISFIALVLLSGPFFDAFGIRWQPVVMLALFVLAAATAWRVRDLPHAPRAEPAVSIRARLAEPRVRWFFVSAALMVFAHGAMYTYLSLHLANLGYSKAQIGIFWVVGIVIEVAFFYTQGRFFARFDKFALLAATFPLAALRFFLTAEFAEFWPLLLLAQLLHAVTFAVHHSASILTIQQWFAGPAAARGQALYISIAYGVGASSGSLLAAWLWTAFGPSAAFLSSSAAALLGWAAVERSRRAARLAELRALPS